MSRFHFGAKRAMNLPSPRPSPHLVMGGPDPTMARQVIGIFTKICRGEV